MRPSPPRRPRSPTRCCCSNYMLRQAKTKEEKLAFFNEVLDRIRGTYFRQTMFAEFLLNTHTPGREGRAADRREDDGDLLRSAAPLSRRRQGRHEDRPDLLRRVGVHSAFLSRVLCLQLRDVDGGRRLISPTRSPSRARPRASGSSTLLSAGGSDYPYNLYKTAGIDMATPVPLSRARGADEPDHGSKWRSCWRRSDASGEGVEQRLRHVVGGAARPWPTPRRRAWPSACRRSLRRCRRRGSRRSVPRRVMRTTGAPDASVVCCGSTGR